MPLIHVRVYPKRFLQFIFPSARLIVIVCNFAHTGEREDHSIIWCCTFYVIVCFEPVVVLLHFPKFLVMQVFDMQYICIRAMRGFAGLIQLLNVTIVGCSIPLF